MHLTTAIFGIATMIEALGPGLCVARSPGVVSLTDRLQFDVTISYFLLSLLLVDSLSMVRKYTSRSAQVGRLEYISNFY